MTFKIIAPRPELRGRIDRRDLLKIAAAATGGAALPRNLFAQEVPSAENPPSQNTTTPAADVGGRFSEGVLPDNRILLFYGFPEVDTMGILGEYTPEELLPILEQQGDEYIAATTDG